MVDVVVVVLVLVIRAETMGVERASPRKTKIRHASITIFLDNLISLTSYTS
ncbi:MAG: hypothetical protein RMI78_03820 [Nitrososphaerota archaeon]|nr:hypothetical protein [Nitrososphaerota archaeon]